ncbi:hypothetical protein WP4W18E11_27040 [Acinetobacter baumannii]|nr:hypothetical protein WP4W18E11_27040 [Acinetobacter baumannii]
MIYVQYHLYINSNENFDKDYYQKAKKEYYETEKAFTSKITFLLMLIQDIEISQLYEKIKLNQAKFSATEFLFEGEFKHEVRQFEKSYDNQQAEQISLMV